MQRRQLSRLLAQLVVLDFAKPEADVPWRLIPTLYVWLRTMDQFKECDQIRTMLEGGVAGSLSGWRLSLFAPSISQRLIGFIFSCRSALLLDVEDMPKHGMADECRHESGFPLGEHWRCRASWMVCLQTCSKQFGRNKSISIPA